jgi:hypothetical protein
MCLHWKSKKRDRLKNWNRELEVKINGRENPNDTWRIIPVGLFVSFSTFYVLFLLENKTKVTSLEVCPSNQLYFAVTSRLLKGLKIPNKNYSVSNSTWIFSRLDGICYRGYSFISYALYRTSFRNLQRQLGFHYSDTYHNPVAVEWRRLHSSFGLTEEVRALLLLKRVDVSTGVYEPRVQKSSYFWSKKIGNSIFTP